MDILHDKRMMKSFIASLAINAVGVCLIGGSRVYSIRPEAVQPGDTAATLHPVPITVATIPLTPLSTTQPPLKQREIQQPAKSLVRPDQKPRLPIVDKVKIAALNRRKLENSKGHLKRGTAASLTAPPQMALATPQDFQMSGKAGSSGSRTTGANASGEPPTSNLRGHVNDKLFERTLTRLERSGSSDRGQNANQIGSNKTPGDAIHSTHDSVAGSRTAYGNASSGDGKLSQQAHGSHLGPNTGHAGKEAGLSNVKGSSLGRRQQEALHDVERHDEARSFQHLRSGTTTATTGQTEQHGHPAHDVSTTKDSHVASEKPSETPSSFLRRAPGQTAHTTGNGTAGSTRNRYVGEVYKGASPVNEQIHQAAALDPGNDPGTAVHALHLPKTAGDTFKGQPGPKQTAGFTYAIPNNDNNSGFEIEPSDLGSTSIFGQVPWGKPSPFNYQDPNAGKDGMGLLGSYYLGRNFDQLEFQRADSNINFIWTFTGPGPLMPSRQPFCVRWTGELVAPYTEPYTIMTASDDGVRVYLNGDLIIDNWTVHAVTEDTATVNLIANQPNDIRVEYFEKNGMSNEIIKLYWESRDTPLEYVPETSLLYPSQN